MHDEEMASDAVEYWERRRDIDPSTDAGGVDADAYRLVLLADVTSPDVLSACHRLSDALGRFECFVPSAPGTFHVTIKMFDVAVDPSTTGVEHAPPAVRRTDRVVATVASEYEPFEVELTRLNLFPDVVYAEIADDGLLAEVNRAVCAHPRIATLDRDADQFIPHLTLGYFRSDAEYGALVDFLEANRELELPTLPVGELTLVAYEVGGRPPTYNHLETYDLSVPDTT